MIKIILLFRCFSVLNTHTHTQTHTHTKLRGQTAQNTEHGRILRALIELIM
jgi:hypothetical protein